MRTSQSSIGKYSNEVRNFSGVGYSDRLFSEFNPGELAKFIVPGMKSLQLSRLKSIRQLLANTKI